MAWSGHGLTLALASGAASAHIARGRQVADGPLANRVRPGTEQPQRVFRPGRSPVSFIFSISSICHLIPPVRGRRDDSSGSPHPGIGRDRNRFLRVFGGRQLLGIVYGPDFAPFCRPGLARFFGGHLMLWSAFLHDFHRSEGPWYLSFQGSGKSLLTRFPRRM